MKFPANSLLAGNFGFRDEFARDCLLQRGVSCEPDSRDPRVAYHLWRQRIYPPRSGDRREIFDATGAGCPNATRLDKLGPRFPRWQGHRLRGFRNSRRCRTRYRAAPSPSDRRSFVLWSDPNLSRGTEGLQTRRWRKPDSNRRYRVTRSRFEERLMPPPLDSQSMENSARTSNRSHENAGCLPRDRWFESGFLQRRVINEPVLARGLPTKPQILSASAKPGCLILRASSSRFSAPTHAALRASSN